MKPSQQQSRATLEQEGRAGAGLADLADRLARLPALDHDALRLEWRNHLGGTPPAHLPRWLFMRHLAYRLQAQVFGGQAFGSQTLGNLDKDAMRAIKTGGGGGPVPFTTRAPVTRDGTELRPHSLLAREWNGRLEQVAVLDKGGFAWNGTTYGSLSQVAKAITGTSWNGHRFFGLKQSHPGKRPAA
jgi:hypothetical protein